MFHDVKQRYSFLITVVTFNAKIDEISDVVKYHFIPLIEKKSKIHWFSFVSIKKPTVSARNDFQHYGNKSELVNTIHCGLTTEIWSYLMRLLHIRTNFVVNHKYIG